MGLLDRAIRKGISGAIGDAVAQGVQRAVQPKIDEVADSAAKAVNSTADQINQSLGEADRSAHQAGAAASSAGGLGGLFGSLKTAAEGFANEAAKNMKICPACETPAGADQVFCPNCGAKLPEQTVAEGALCPSCGKQNSVGQKFCDSCGAKLPAALAQEQAIREKNAAVLAQWDSLLPQYPKWSFGGELSLEKTYTDECGNPCYSLGVDMASREMLEQYGQLLMQSGFRTAGRYPTADALYKKVGAVCYCCSWEHAFDAGEDCLTVDFLIREPSGGFDYVKPEPRAKTAGLAGEIAGGLLGRFKR